MSEGPITPRDRFIAALERRPLSGRVPHFELVFFLTMEAFGKVHPRHRSYSQWDQMEMKEQRLHRKDAAQVFIQTAERFDHSAIFIHPYLEREDEMLRLVDEIRDQSGDRFFLMVHGDATFAIPDGNEMYEFAYRMADEPDKLQIQARDQVDKAVVKAERLKRHGGLDGFALCSDYCLNTGPFLSPARFDQFITPYLIDLVAAYRDLGFYVIKHTDGNILPIVDRLVEAAPHALHSLDPQAGVDIAEIKRLYGNRICLIGNVNCGLLDTGSDEEIVESTRYALQHGMPDGGYIFSTSNCIYTGMRLSQYELMLTVWRNEGHYPI